MQQLGAVLATEGGPGLPGSEIDAILKNLKGLQEQVALLDRMQNIRSGGASWGWLGARVCGRRVMGGQCWGGSPCSLARRLGSGGWGLSSQHALLRHFYPRCMERLQSL
jgi:hypothetical protein